MKMNPRSGGYPQIIHLNGIFHCKPSSYWGTLIYGNPHIDVYSLLTWAIEHGPWAPARAPHSPQRKQPGNSPPTMAQLQTDSILMLPENVHFTSEQPKILTSIQDLWISTTKICLLHRNNRKFWPASRNCEYPLPKYAFYIGTTENSDQHPGIVNIHYQNMPFTSEQPKILTSIQELWISTTKICLLHRNNRKFWPASRNCEYPLPKYAFYIGKPRILTSIQELWISTIKPGPPRTSQDLPGPPRTSQGPLLRGAGRHVVQGTQLGEGILRCRGPGCHGGYPQSSSILDGDFPCKPSICLGVLSLKPPDEFPIRISYGAYFPFWYELRNMNLLN